MEIGLDEKVDWFRLIVELCNAHGYTHSTIAAAVGRNCELESERKGTER